MSCPLRPVDRLIDVVITTSTCYNCTKRRIVCDLTPPRCNKCAKKGLECPGFGIRYRFADAKTAPSSEPELAGSSPASSSSSRKRRRNLEWIDVSDRVKKKGRRTTEYGDGASTVGSTTSAASKCLSEDKAVCTRPVNVKQSGTFQPESTVTTGGEDRVDATRSHEDVWPFRVPDAPEVSSAAADDDNVVELAPADGLAIPILPEVPVITFGLPPLLSNPDPRTRLLFDHFSTHVSPVMLMYDNETNGYRHEILPLAHCDPLVERAVCVAAAFHLSRRMPELRLPAENGRAVIIRKMSEMSFDLSDSAWATLVLLIVADLVTGHEHVITLYKMLVAFLDARGQHSRSESPLSEFLYYQSKLISFFAYPALGESQAVADFSQVLNDPLGSFEQYAPRGRQSLDFLVPGNRPRSSTQVPLDPRTKLYMEIVRDATEVYLLRARTSNEPSYAQAPDNAAAPLLQPPVPNIDAANAAIEDVQIASNSMQPRIERIRNLLSQVDPFAPGAHTMVWPAFVAAAESRGDDDREFFCATLRRIWESTGYANVLGGLNALPGIWERQEQGQRWTAALPNLKTVVM